MYFNISSIEEKLDGMDVLLPSFVFICLLITVGIPGNILAILVYRLKLTTATGRYAIISLAVCDIINCVLSIPVELYIMTRYWNFDIAPLCKMSRFFTYAMNNSSALILLAIAVERYRAVCFPHKRKISNSCILKACLVLIVVGVIIALPALWIYGIQTDVFYYSTGFSTDSPNYAHMYNNSGIYHSGPYIGFITMTNMSKYKDNNIQIETKRCLIDDKYRQTWFAYSHFGFVTIAAEIILVILIVIYVQIGRKIIGLRGMHICSSDERRMRSSGKKKKQATLVLFLITLAFEFTFLPFLIISNLRFFKEPDWYETQSMAGKMAYHFFLRSYYFNNAVNPLIYCVSSGNFRTALLELLQKAKQRLTLCSKRPQGDF